MLKMKKETEKKIQKLFTVYVEMGTASTDNAQLSFTFDSTVTTVARSYEVKVSQIECSNLNR